jgi:hypothetical protein
MSGFDPYETWHGCLRLTLPSRVRRNLLSFRTVQSFIGELPIKSSMAHLGRKLVDLGRSRGPSDQG